MQLKVKKAILISHRGNINGPSLSLENRPDYIMKTLNMGYHVEIDIWKGANGCLLGHDAPQYHVTEQFLKQPNLWLHAKNVSAFEWILNNSSTIRGFWHENDKVAAVTSGYITGGFIWTANLDVFGENVIHMINNDNIAHSLIPIYNSRMFERDLAGICSDYIEKISFNLVENEDPDNKI